MVRLMLWLAPLLACATSCAVQIDACSTDGDCGSVPEARSLICDMALGACVTSCDPLRTSQECAGDHVCRLRSLDDPRTGVCAASEIAVGPEDSCVATADCPQGYVCAGTCERLCDDVGRPSSSECATGRVCTAVEGLSGLLGVCL